MRRDEAVEAVKPRKAPAKRVAARKAKETAKKHVIVQAKKESIDKQQELPIEDEDEDDLAKKETVEDKQDLPTKEDPKSLSARGDLGINCFTMELDCFL